MKKWKYLKYFSGLYWNFTFLRPLLAGIYDTIFPSAMKFSGLGLTTRHELPWNDDYEWSVFRKASIDMKKCFDFNDPGITMGIDLKNIDTCLYRHWIVSYAVRCAIEFAENNDFNFVECGTAEGYTTFFALREICEHKKTANNFTMHLYDSWDVLKKDGLTKSESVRVGYYKTLSIDRTKKNLAEFNDKVIYHQGYIPESFSASPEPPHSIIFLHIDLNAAKSTIDTLNFFLPRLSKRGIVLFDDYGHLSFKDTKKAIDEFFADEPGVLQKLPTGQAIYYR